MFTALAASAFIVRVRMSARSECAARMAQARAAALEAEHASAALEAELGTLPGVLDESNHAAVERASIDPMFELRTASGPVPVELISEREARRRAEAELSVSERADLEAFRARARGGETEIALEIWNALPATSPARYLLAGERSALAEDWLATQLARMDRELARRDCGAVEERLARLVRLLPDRPLPHKMGDCP